MSTPTPRPWHRRIGRKGNGSTRSQHEQVCNAQDVAAVMLEHDGSPEGEANAALIVRAVNAHDALVEALKGVADFDPSDPHKEGWEREDGWCWCDGSIEHDAECLAARAALALVKGEGT